MAALCVVLRRHDESRATIARDAATLFGSGDQATFDAMLANADLLESRDLQLLAERNGITVETTLTALPSWTWQQLGEQARATTALYESAATEALATIDAADTGSLSSRLIAAREKLAAARAAEETLEARVKARLATVEQFNTAIDRLRAGTADFKSLRDVPAALSTLVENAKAADNARGLQLELLELARELADVEVDRLSEELRLMRWKTAQAGEILARINAVVGEDGALPRIAAFAATQPQQNTIASTVRNLAMAGVENDLRRTLDILMQFGAAAGYERLYLNQSALMTASEEQRSAIRMSAVNLRERAVLIRHGLEGLSSYYAGGITSAELANILDAAQVIALAIIAGRVQ